MLQTQDNTEIQFSPNSVHAAVSSLETWPSAAASAGPASRPARGRRFHSASPRMEPPTMLAFNPANVGDSRTTDTCSPIVHVSGGDVRGQRRRQRPLLPLHLPVKQLECLILPGRAGSVELGGSGYLRRNLQVQEWRNLQSVLWNGPGQICRSTTCFTRMGGNLQTASLPAESW